MVWERKFIPLPLNADPLLGRALIQHWCARWKQGQSLPSPPWRKREELSKGGPAHPCPAFSKLFGQSVCALCECVLKMAKITRT